MNEQEEFKLICFLDKYRCQSDYGDINNCIRLIGFEPDEIAENTEKCIFITLDVDVDELCQVRSTKGNFYVKKYLVKFIDGEFFALIKYRKSRTSKSYLYKTISEDPPTFIEITSVSFQGKSGVKFKNSRNIMNFITNRSKTALKPESIISYDTYQFKCFNVGQGMCSLIHSEKTGYLLDLGAGTPIKRGDYIKKSYKNELKSITSNLDSLHLIISHMDSDHYRIYCWDKDIRDKIKTVYIPANASWILEKDSCMRSAIRHTNHLSISGKNMQLSISRTSPENIHSKNNNALICLLNINEKTILLPGDYVYKNFGSDRNTSVSDLKNNKYDYIVVPHHGDNQSQYEIPDPVMKNTSIAYFSAGDHRGYGHPTQTAIDAHENAGYCSLKNNSTLDIIIMHQE